jgi:hypothetical protein
MGHESRENEMEPEDLQTLPEITLGRKVAHDVCRQCDDDPFRAAETLNRRVDSLRAPYRPSGPPDNIGSGRAGKEIARLPSWPGWSTR